MSLVSHRWRHLWKYLQVFHLNNSDFSCNKKFALFVNAVLALRRSRDIRKFNLHLEWSFEDYRSVEMWVLAATGPHLEEMSITNMSDAGITLPPSFFVNCTNLVSLSLSGDIYWKHSSIHSPSLKKFDLHGVPDWDQVFLSGFPALETVETFFKDGNFMNEIFGQPSSNSMSLKSTNDNLTWTYLASSSHDMTLGIVSYFQSMAEVFLHVFPPCESEFIDPILEELDDFEDISLVSRHSTSKGPLHAPVLNYPEFHSLQHLKFILPCFNSNLLLNVLEKCHVLQVLIIQSNKEEPPPSRTWEPQSTTIPKCLKTHLTYIHIQGYQGFDDELTFAEYILHGSH
ncbi:hypothetical protein QL285_053394 [Trifolium repens]|nr:hypothetical protein QL285_053394 [Trifolium repens]